MANIKITTRVVESMKPGEIIWDRDLKGFAVRCQRRAKVYYLVKRINGRVRWLSIGKHGEPYTPATARDRALALLGDIVHGKDVVGERERRKEALTFEELCDRFLKEHAQAKRSAQTVREYRRLLKNYVIPKLGKYKADSIKQSDIKGLHSSLHETPFQANRVLAVISKIFSWLDPQEPNPCKGIERYKEEGRERFLSDQELLAVGNALGKAESTESPYAVAAIRLLLFTGARLSEILTLQWDHVDFQRGLLNLPKSKTGKKSIILNAPALDILANLPRVTGNPYVIVGGKDGQHLNDLQKPWQRIRRLATIELWRQDVKAREAIDTLDVDNLTTDHVREHVEDLRGGLEDVRLHDLRHSHGSVAATTGHTTLVIAKLLGHRNTKTAERYAHLADDPLKAASETIGQRIRDAMSDPEGGEVVPMQRGRN